MKKGARARPPGAEIAHPLANVLFEGTEKVNGLLQLPTNCQVAARAARM